MNLNQFNDASGNSLQLVRQLPDHAFVMSIRSARALCVSSSQAQNSSASWQRCFLRWQISDGEQANRRRYWPTPCAMATERHFQSRFTDVNAQGPLGVFSPSRAKKMSKFWMKSVRERWRELFNNCAGRSVKLGSDSPKASLNKSL